MTSFERSRKRRWFFVDLDLLTFGTRGVYADSYHYRRYEGVDAKRHASKSSRYNAKMPYASYSLHVRLRLSRCMHEHSSARFQSASRVKRRDFIRTFQKAAVFFVDLDLLTARCFCRLVVI